MILNIAIAAQGPNFKRATATIQNLSLRDLAN